MEIAHHLVDKLKVIKHFLTINGSARYLDNHKGSMSLSLICCAPMKESITMNMYCVFIDQLVWCLSTCTATMQHVNLPLNEEEDEEEEEEERVGGAHLAHCQSNLLRIFLLIKKNYCVLTCFLVKINVINVYLFCN